MTDSERLAEIIKSSGMSAKRFSEYIGTKSPQVMYDILKGRNGISKDLADKIHAHCVNYTHSWILTGFGNKYVDMSVFEDSAKSETCIEEYKEGVKRLREELSSAMLLIHEKDNRIADLREMLSQQKEIIEMLKKDIARVGVARRVAR